jgi:hypothetical protein
MKWGAARCLRRSFWRGNIRAMSCSRAKSESKFPVSFLRTSEGQFAFRNYPSLLDTILDDPRLEHTFARLISAGSAPEVLLFLLNGCTQWHQSVAVSKKELDWAKGRFDSVLRRLVCARQAVIDLSTIRIQGNSLWDSSSFDLINSRVGTDFSRQFTFVELPGNLNWAEAFLKELKQNLAKEYAVRRLTLSRQIAWLYLYSGASAQRRVTFCEMADLLNAGLIANNGVQLVSEASVRMSLQRFKRSDVAMSYERLRVLMKDYVRSSPGGIPTLEDWLSANCTDWISSHISFPSDLKFPSSDDLR